MKKATVYKKMFHLKKAIEKCPVVKLTYVKYSEYALLSLDHYKVFQQFNIKPAAIHPEYTNGRFGWKYSKISGYRISLEVANIIKANEKMLDDIAQYL